MTYVDYDTPLCEQIIEAYMAGFPHDVAVQAYHHEIRAREEQGDMETADHVRVALSRLCDGHLPCEENTQ